MLDMLDLDSFQDILTDTVELEIFERIYSRLMSSNPVRRYSHEMKFIKIVRLAEEEQPDRIIDIGRGGSVDGIAGLLLAQKGFQVTISNPLPENLALLKKLANHLHLDNIKFHLGNPLDLCCSNDSFDLVLSLHVLEHLSDMKCGLAEIHRVSKKTAIIAVPTCCNLAVLARLGGGKFLQFEWKAPLFLLSGIFKFIFHIIMGDESMNENMLEFNNKVWVHKWFFPWKYQKILQNNGFTVKIFGPDSMCLPWFRFWLPFVKILDRYSKNILFRYLGLGSHALVIKDIDE